MQRLISFSYENRHGVLNYVNITQPKTEPNFPTMNMTPLKGNQPLLDVKTVILYLPNCIISHRYRKDRKSTNISRLFSTAAWTSLKKWKLKLLYVKTATSYSICQIALRRFITITYPDRTWLLIRHTCNFFFQNCKYIHKSCNTFTTTRGANT